MTWHNVLSRIVWRPDVPADKRPMIESYMQAAYASSITADLMELSAGTGAIRIGYSSDIEPGRYTGYYDQAGSFISFNVTAIDRLHYFNRIGVLVKEIPALTVAHEFVHFVLKGDYADPVYDPVAMNGANYDFDGLITGKQNEIAIELGHLDNLQVSYHSALLSVDTRFGSLIVGHSYTDGNLVDVVRFGDSGGTVADNIDHTLRNDKLRDLLFGFGGDDTIRAGKGDDYVYGGAGEDEIWGGDGHDVLVGEAEDDQFSGEKGNDVIWGGDKGNDQGTADGNDTVDYSAVGAGVTITFTGDGAATTLAVADGDGGIDTLHSIEEIVGTAQRDVFRYGGDIPQGYQLVIDAGSGQSADDVINTSASTADAGLTVLVQTNGETDNLFTDRLSSLR